MTRDDPPPSNLLRSLLLRARESRLVLLSDAQARLAPQVARAVAETSLRLRVPMLDRASVLEELAAMVIEATGVPTAPRQDGDALVEAAGDALRIARVPCLELSGTEALDEPALRDVLARWVDATETTIFVVTKETGDHETSRPRPDLTTDEVALLGALAAIPTVVPLRVLDELRGCSTGQTVLDLARRELVACRWASGDLLIELPPQQRRAIPVAPSFPERAVQRVFGAGIQHLGEPMTPARAAYCSRHRALLRWAYERERASNPDAAAELALPLLSAMAPLGPLTSMIEITKLALSNEPPPRLGAALTLRRAMLLRAAARGREAADELDAATRDGCASWPSAIAGEAGLALEILATPELDRPELRDRAAVLRSRLDSSLPAERAIELRARAAAQWTGGTAEAAFSLALEAMAAYVASGDEPGQLEMLALATVYAVGGSNPLALELADDLGRAARRFERGDLEARAHALRGCALLDAGRSSAAVDALTVAIDRLEHAGFRHFERWHRAHRGFARALAGDVAGAARDFEDFIAMTEVVGGSDLFGVLAGAVVGSKAGLARLASLHDIPPFLAPHARIIRHSAEPAERSRQAAQELGAQAIRAVGYYAFEVRALERLMLSDQLVRAPPNPQRVLRLAPDASWFELDGGARVTLARSRTVRRVFAGLVDARRAGKPLSVTKIFAIGWPGERASAGSIANRVHVTICRLRSTGLKDGLVFSGAGWEIDPSISIERP